MLETRDPNETRMIYMSMSILGLSIVAIIFFVVGLTIVFYVVAVITVIVGYYFARNIPTQPQKGQAQAPRRRQT